MNSLKALRTEFDICVLGNANTGKSSLVLHFLYNTFIESESSIEDLYIKDIRNGHIYNQVSILDTSSAVDSYSSSRKTQILNTATIVYVYSVADYESYQSIYELHERILNIRNDLPPIVLVGTKCDLDEKRQVSYDEGVELSKTIGAISFTECSAFRGFGIHETFKPLIDHLLLTKREKIRQESIVSLTQIQKEMKKVPQTPLAFEEDEITFFKDDKIDVVPEESNQSEEKKQPEIRKQRINQNTKERRAKSHPKPEESCCVIT